MPSLERLRNAISSSEKALTSFRDQRIKLIKEYCGPQYRGDEEEEKRPQFLPLMNQAIDTYVQVLVANRPRALVTATEEEFKWFAKHYERSVNEYIKEIRLQEELQACVLEACFMFGVMKVYYAEDTPRLIEGTDNYVDPGKPYAEHLSLDNFGYDVTASSWRKVSYAWDDYEVDAEKLLDDNDFAHAHDAIRRAIEGDSAEPSKSTAAKVMGTEGDEQAHYLRKIKIRDIWIPSESRVITTMASPSDKDYDDEKTILRQIDDVGDESGPYHILSFIDVPGAIMGVSPAMKLSNLSRLINSLYRKLANQARRQRLLPIYEKGHEQDAKNIASAEDGRWTSVKHKDSVDILNQPGADAGTMQFGMGALDLYDRMAGNLQAMAGLGASSETLGQDQMIQQQVSKLQNKMQERVVNFTRDIVRDLGWLLWNDQVREISTEYVIPGTNMWARSDWTPDHREGDFIDYNFDIDPYSLPYQSPMQRSNALLTYVGQIAAPMQQMFAQQGGSIDFRKLTEYWSELNNLPRLKEIVPFQDEAVMDMEPGAEPPPGRASQTSRTHVRNNVSTGQGQQGNGQDLKNAVSSIAQGQGQGQTVQSGLQNG